MSAAAGGASIHDGSVIIGLAVWGVVFLSTIWFSFLNFRRAFKPLRKELSDTSPQTEAVAPVSKSHPLPPSGDYDAKRANEKLVALLRKPKK